MSEKKGKQKIEDVAADLLDSDMKKNMLEFVEYSKNNNLPILQESASIWRVYFEKKALCAITLKSGSISYIPKFDYSEDFDNYIEKENLHEIIWGNLSKCAFCGNGACLKETKKNRETFNGFSKTYFGKVFDATCKHREAVFLNPDEQAMNCIKKLIEYQRDTVIGNKWQLPQKVMNKNRIVNY